MQVKAIIISVTMWLTAILSISAQDDISDRPFAQKNPNTVPPFTFLSSPSATTTTASSNAQFGEDVVNTAMQYLGARYSRGATGPRTFDCSGFTSYVYRKNNVSLLRTSRSQYTQGVPVSRSQLKKGDLVFFGGSRSRRSVGHVGIVSNVDPSGNGFSFVHASNSGVRVSKSSERYYSVRYIGARRIVNN